jgi:hypothetical protein
MASPVRLAYRSREAGEGGSMTTHASAHHATMAGGSFVAGRGAVEGADVACGEVAVA